VGTVGTVTFYKNVKMGGRTKRKVLRTTVPTVPTVPALTPSGQKPCGTRLLAEGGWGRLKPAETIDRPQPSPPSAGRLQDAYINRKKTLRAHSWGCITRTPVPC